MSKVRVYELAKEVGVDNKDVIEQAVRLALHRVYVFRIRNFYLIAMNLKLLRDCTIGLIVPHIFTPNIMTI